MILIIANFQRYRRKSECSVVVGYLYRPIVIFLRNIFCAILNIFDWIIWVPLVSYWKAKKPQIKLLRIPWVRIRIRIPNAAPDQKHP